MNIPEKNFFTPPELVKMLGIGKTQVYNLLSSGQIPVVKLGSLYLVERSVVVGLLKPSVPVPVAVPPKPKINPESWMLSIVNYYKKTGVPRVYFSASMVLDLIGGGLVDPTIRGRFGGRAGTAYSVLLVILNFFGKKTVKELGGAMLSILKLDKSAGKLRHVFLIEFVTKNESPLPELYSTGLSPAVGASQQERAEDPALAWLGKVVLAIVENGGLGKDFSATDILELCKKNSVDIRSICSMNFFAGMQSIGKILARIFREEKQLVIENHIVERTVYRGKSKNRPLTKIYTVTKQS